MEKKYQGCFWTSWLAFVFNIIVEAFSAGALGDGPEFLIVEDNKLIIVRKRTILSKEIKLELLRDQISSVKFYPSVSTIRIIHSNPLLPKMFLFRSLWRFHEAQKALKEKGYSY